MSAVKDVRWYNRKVVDREGRLRRYGGGPLRRFSLELDAYFYGIARLNQVRRDFAGVQAVCRLLERFAGVETDLPHIPEPVDEDTTIWVQELHTIWDSTMLAGSGDPSDPSVAVDFKLDVLHALADLPKSWLAAFVHFMDGYTLDEVRGLAAKDPGRPWSIETAERNVRRASSYVRKHLALDVPGKRRQPQPGRPLSVINDVELVIADIRRRTP